MAKGIKRKRAKARNLLERVLAPLTPDDLALALSYPNSPVFKKITNMILNAEWDNLVIEKIIHLFIVQQQTIQYQEKVALLQDIRKNENKMASVHSYSAESNIKEIKKQLAVFGKLMPTIQFQQMTNDVARLETELASLEVSSKINTMSWNHTVTTEITNFKEAMKDQSFKDAEGNILTDENHIDRVINKLFGKDSPPPIEVMGIVLESYAKAGQPLLGTPNAIAIPDMVKHAELTHTVGSELKALNEIITKPKTSAEINDDGVDTTPNLKPSDILKLLKQNQSLLKLRPPVNYAPVKDKAQNQADHFLKSQTVAEQLIASNTILAKPDVINEQGIDVSHNLKPSDVKKIQQVNAPLFKLKDAGSSVENEPSMPSPNSRHKIYEEAIKIINNKMKVTEASELKREELAQLKLDYEPKIEPKPSGP